MKKRHSNRTIPTIGKIAKLLWPGRQVKEFAYLMKIPYGTATNWLGGYSRAPIEAIEKLDQYAIMRVEELTALIKTAPDSEKQTPQQYFHEYHAQKAALKKAEVLEVSL